MLWIVRVCVCVCWYGLQFVLVCDIVVGCVVVGCCRLWYVVVVVCRRRVLFVVWCGVWLLCVAVC